jgi:hypothetical protein
MTTIRNDDPRRLELINTLFQLRGVEFSRCFAPGPKCERPAVRAHSVQNSRCLDLLARDGHVVALTHRLDIEEGLLVQFSNVGRNRATTFAGLCELHDHDLFAPIETRPLELTIQEHLFLLAYRATIFELHATCAAGWLLQTGYQRRVELGLDPKDQPTPAGIYATHRMMVAYETYQYKQAFDQIYASRAFGSLAHDVLILDVPRPTVAASALFDLDNMPNAKGEAVRVCLTVLPLSNPQTAAVLSYLPEDAPLARVHLQRIIGTAGDYQKYELSRALLNYCSNFVVAPDFVDTWTTAKREIIRDYYSRTILRSDLEFEHPDLLLF